MYTMQQIHSDHGKEAEMNKQNDKEDAEEEDDFNPWITVAMEDYVDYSQKKLMPRQQQQGKVYFYSESHKNQVHADQQQLSDECDEPQPEPTHTLDDDHQETAWVMVEQSSPQTKRDGRVGWTRETIDRECSQEVNEKVSPPSKASTQEVAPKQEIQSQMQKAQQEQSDPIDEDGSEYWRKVYKSKAASTAEPLFQIVKDGIPLERLSMYELLSQPTTTLETGERKQLERVQTPSSSLDPKNYAFLPPEYTKHIHPAGIKSDFNH